MNIFMEDLYNPYIQKYINIKLNIVLIIVYRSINITI